MKKNKGVTNDLQLYKDSFQSKWEIGYKLIKIC